jgi:hypothetical protein
VIENLDHFMVENEALLRLLGWDVVRKVLEDLLYGYCNLDGLEFGLLMFEDVLDALFDLLEGDWLLMCDGLRLAHVLV